MKALKTLFTIALMSASLSVFAIGLDEAKAQGLVGEKASGYLGVPNKQAATADVIELIKSINNKRKAKYTEIALKNNLQTDAVAKMANKKAIEKTQAGNYYQAADGQWLKK